MGFKQTAQHRNGKASFHQIGLVRGQFGNIPMDQWVKFIADAGFDGWEEASWELDLAKCDTDAGAEAYAKERVALAKKHDLEIFTVATHLQGQALGDEPSAKTLQFCGGEAVEHVVAERLQGGFFLTGARRGVRRRHKVRPAVGGQHLPVELQVQGSEREDARVLARGVLEQVVRVRQPLLGGAHERSPFGVEAFAQVSQLLELLRFGEREGDEAVGG